MFKDYLKTPELITEDTPDEIDDLAVALAKVKNKTSSVYKRIHKLMMTGNIEKAKEGLKLVKKFQSTLNETTKTPEELLRAAHFKIKLTTPTKFGTQIDFAKKYEDDDIIKVLKKFTLKFDDKSVFVID